MKKFICPCCGKEMWKHDVSCGEIGHANRVPELHPVAEFLESVPLCVRIIALALIAIGIGYSIALIGQLL